MTSEDSAACVPKSLVVDPQFDWSGQPARLGRLRVSWDETILYELHVKGFTKLHPAVPEKLRGTYEGLADPAVIDYVKALGVTSIELLPIHTFITDSHLHDLNLTNFWGYNSIGFFFLPIRDMPRRHGEPLHEFKEMVARYHEAGIEVILDVVYNHTAEGNEMGPTLSFKGIDNASYYRLLPNNPRYYINDTGTGNTVNVSHPRVLQMVCDSLRYWVEQTHVDGFRFDLGTILAREPNGFDNKSGFLKAVVAGSNIEHHQVDCRTVGHRPGRLPGGWLSAGMDGVERQVPRHSARVLEGRQQCGRTEQAADGLGRPLQLHGSQALGIDQFRHCARRVHHERSGELQREA